MQILLPADASETPDPPAPTANCRCGVEGWPTVSRNNRIIGGQKYSQVTFPLNDLPADLHASYVRENTPGLWPYGKETLNPISLATRPGYNTLGMGGEAAAGPS